VLRSMSPVSPVIKVGKRGYALDSARGTAANSRLVPREFHISHLSLVLPRSARANTGSLGDMPLIVLSHDPQVNDFGGFFSPADLVKAENAWMEM
jgi:hypothetical protein